MKQRNFGATNRRLGIHQWGLNTDFTLRDFTNNLQKFCKVFFTFN